jgi:DNA-binding MarR family transcriptional regulator
MSRRQVHLDRGADPLPANASRMSGRAVMRLLDAIDRARLTTMDVLLLLHVAEAEATVGDLAEQIDRRPAEVRRATGRLVARGLMRRRADRTVPWGLIFTATASGRDLLARLELPSTPAGPMNADGRRPPRRAPRHRRLGAGRGAPG